MSQRNKEYRNIYLTPDASQTTDVWRLETDHLTMSVFLSGELSCLLDVSDVLAAFPKSSSFGTCRSVIQKFHFIFPNVTVWSLFLLDCNKLYHVRVLCAASLSTHSRRGRTCCWGSYRHFFSSENPACKLDRNSVSPRSSHALPKVVVFAPLLLISKESSGRWHLSPLSFELGGPSTFILTLKSESIIVNWLMAHGARSKLSSLLINVNSFLEYSPSVYLSYRFPYTAMHIYLPAELNGFQVLFISGMVLPHVRGWWLSRSNLHRRSDCVLLLQFSCFGHAEIVPYDASVLRPAIGFFNCDECFIFYLFFFEANLASVGRLYRSWNSKLVKNTSDCGFLAVYPLFVCVRIIVHHDQDRTPFISGCGRLVSHQVRLCSGHFRFQIRSNC